ncbi:MAG: GNAT family N-acetyltransferase [Myxococcales bacterium]|nr:GNAT family N-acetyltransferase [Myxococcales bacterium]
MKPVLRRMTPEDAQGVADLARVVIGPGYYRLDEVHAYLERSVGANGVALSYVAVDGPRVVGFRFVLPPGAWEQGRGEGLHPDRWPGPLEKAAYFQSCFVALDAMGHGIGKRLARLAFADLHRLGAELVVTHSWKESPHDSSRRYLRRLGFSEVAELPEYWVDVDYVCRLDGKPCRCTAVECVRPITAADADPRALEDLE